MNRAAAARQPHAPQPLAPSRHSSDAEKSQHIRHVVLQAGEALRQRHPWLRQQNAIGVGLMTLAVLGMLASGAAYLQGWLPWWACIPLTAFFASITHELEHDLIHQMYFRQRPWANALMMVVAWLARPNSVNPFIRRDLHLHHHKYSGSSSDLEERGITNGVRWSIWRVVMTVDNVIGILMRHGEIEACSQEYIRLQNAQTRLRRWILNTQKVWAFTPVGWFYYVPLYTCVGWHLAQTLAPSLAPLLGLNWAPGADTLQHMQWLDAYAVVYLLPNTLRGACLFFISSNMHYYGDIDHRNVMQQCQVLHVWWLWPFQAFCFNFGSTHAIHHFAVKEPFYIRQWTAPIAHQVMRNMGVRFNDLGAFRRDNRWGPSPWARA